MNCFFCSKPIGFPIEHSFQDNRMFHGQMVCEKCFKKLLNDMIKNYLEIAGIHLYNENFNFLTLINPFGRKKNPLKKPKITRSLSIGKKIKVFKRDGFKCVYCGSKKKLTVDHIRPQSKGGSHKFINLQTLCNTCNSKKGNKYEVV